MGSGFRLSVVRVRVQGLGIGFQGLQFRVPVLRTRVQELRV